MGRNQNTDRYSGIGPVDKSTFRYQFDKSKPRKKFRCPNPECGRMSLTRYIDVTTGEYLPEQFGICDREEKCGYHCIPTGSDLGDNDLFIPSTKIKDIYKVDEEKIPNCISHSTVMESLGNYERNNLTRFLFKHFDKDIVWKIITRYKIGTTNVPWPNSIIFWQFDSEYNARTGKVMDYDPNTCKRIKQDLGGGKIWNHINWMHTLDGQDYILRQVLFGAHLIIDKIKTYYLVESEKSALICAIKNPKSIVLATGGLQNLREEMMIPLKDKKIIAIPDKGGAFHKWQKKIDENLSDYDIELSKKLENSDLVGEGDDIGDLILKEMGL